MYKKLTLTSILAIVVACPSYAVISADDNNPVCDSDTIGATSGSTNLEAIWNVLTVRCNPGTYLDKTTATCVTCPDGQYCPGGDFNVEMANVGNNACSALGDGSYTLTNETENINANQCYKTLSSNCENYKT